MRLGSTKDSQPHKSRSEIISLQTNGRSKLRLRLNKWQNLQKWFNTQKGYGFINPDEGNDVFVHIAAVQNSGLNGLSEGKK